MLKRMLCLFLTCLLLTSMLQISFAVEAQMTEDEIIELDENDENSKDNKNGESAFVAEARKRYSEGHFNIPKEVPSSLNGYTALYTAEMKISASMRDKSDDKLGNKTVSLPKAAKITIYEVLPDWVLAEYNGKTGYLLRVYLNEDTITTLDTKNTAPYGVQKPKFVGETTEAAFIYNKPDKNSVPFKVPIAAGAKLAIMDFEDGFAKVIVWRNYGYVDGAIIKSLEMVSPTDVPLSEYTPIAAYCSFYEHDIGKESNDSRCVNIEVSCKYMSTTINPGESFDFNGQVGPYSMTKGYQAAPVLINGTTELGYGGGTCQSSSTLYNTLLQLPNVAILKRRPHGPSSAKYLPQHQDAAVGNDKLNFIFRNDYDFPIRIEASAVDGCLSIRVFKVE